MGHPNQDGLNIETGLGSVSVSVTKTQSWCHLLAAIKRISLFLLILISLLIQMNQSTAFVIRCLFPTLWNWGQSIRNLSAFCQIFIWMLNVTGFLRRYDSMWQWECELYPFVYGFLSLLCPIYILKNVYFVCPMIIIVLQCYLSCVAVPSVGHEF